jgi:chromosome segregation ATPase
LAQAEARLVESDRIVAEWETGESARLTEVEKLLADESAIAAQKQMVADLVTAVQQKQNLEKERQQVQRETASAEARLAEIERLVTAWSSEGQQEKADVAKRLESGEYELEARQALATLDEAETEVGYEAAAHEAARQRRDALPEASKRRQELMQAQAAVKPLAEALADVEKQAKEQEQTVTDLRQQQEIAVAQLTGMTADIGDLAAM